MKYLVIAILPFLVQSKLQAQQKEKSDFTPVILKTESRIASLSLAITYVKSQGESKQYPVLFIHGASFPSALAFGFKMNGYSWMDYMASQGFDVYALDFLGYGFSDRYPEMSSRSATGAPLGTANSVYEDVDKAVNFILNRSGKGKVHIIAHSWGSTVASLYVSRFPEKVDKFILFAPITLRNDTSSYARSDTMFESMTPETRVNAMRSLTPEGKPCALESDVLNSWESLWLQSDTLAKIFDDGFVRYPSGANNDIQDLLHNKSYYSPDAIRSPTLIIRGEWDKYPNGFDAEQLFQSLDNAPYKKYVVIEKGTHVMHLEQSRSKLYAEVLNFLRDKDSFYMDTTKQIAVIFEVIPLKGKKNEYLNIASHLRSELEKIDGFVSIERFQSLSNPDKILSLSFWKDEESVKHWRNTEFHRVAQVKGRNGIFKDYRLRVVSVIRDYGMFDRTEAPSDSKAVHDGADKK